MNAWASRRCGRYESDMPSGCGEQEARAVVERVAGERREARVPHQAGIERRVDHHRRAALVARAGATRPDDAVLVDADRDRLRVAEDRSSASGILRRRCRRSGRVIVSNQSSLPASAKRRSSGRPRLIVQRRLHLSRETRAAELQSQPGVQQGLSWPRGSEGWHEHGDDEAAGDNADGESSCNRPPPLSHPGNLSYDLSTAGRSARPRWRSRAGLRASSAPRS